jgi:hypothetical protein
MANIRAETKDKHGLFLSPVMKQKTATLKAEQVECKMRFVRWYSLALNVPPSNM